MRLFGLEVTRAKNAHVAAPVSEHRGGWWPVVREPFAGAWQRNIDISPESVLSFSAAWAATTLIASDVAKMRLKLSEDRGNDIWKEVHSPSFTPVLTKPNRYQNHIQFKEWWMLSKLTRGNTYVLKERDGRGGEFQGSVRALYLLDPSRVTPRVAPDGSVFYELKKDDLSGLQQESVIVPASEIIHDRFNCLFHPLVGVSPIFAYGLNAMVGLNIQKNAEAFFFNGSNPSGILTAPGTIQQVTADRLKEQWEANYGGANSGRVAILGDGLTFEALRMTAVDAQMIEFFKMTQETVCSALHVPAFKIGAGTMPTYSNGDILDNRYYSDCLQFHIESMELCLDEGLGIGRNVKVEGRTLGVELDLDGLIRMDTAAQYDSLAKAVGGAIMAPNEARQKIDLEPVPGGDTPYLQQQNYSLAALDERDRNGPFDKPPAPAPSPEPDPPPAGGGDDDEDEAARAVFTRVLKAVA